MRSSSYLQKRNGYYHFRYRIPSDLSSHFPQTEIVKSLKTKNLKIAQGSSLQYLQTIIKTFSLLRLGYITTLQAQESLYGVLGVNVSNKQAVRAYRPNMEASRLSMVMQSYVQEKSPEWTAKTKMETTGVFKLLLDLLGDVPVESIDRSRVRDLRDSLLKLPPNVYKAHSRLSPLEVLNRIGEGRLSDVTPMSITSVNKHLSRLSSLMIHAINEGLRADNPVSGLSVKNKARRDEERKAYSLTDLVNILKNLPMDKSKPERLWVPLICMYSGLRLNEACQLYREDIKEVDGIWCLDVNDSKDKRLKNTSSCRLVPVHPKLIELGFIEYVKNCQDERLWMSLSWSELDGYSRLLGQWYQRFNRKFVTDDPLKTFHSLRHSFADTLKQLGVQKEIIAELMGHTQESITMGRYGKRYKPEVLLEVVRKLDYGC